MLHLNSAEWGTPDSFKYCFRMRLDVRSADQIDFAHGGLAVCSFCGKVGDRLVLQFQRMRYDKVKPNAFETINAQLSSCVYPPSVCVSTASAHQPLGSANAETTPARAPAAAADRKQ